MNKADEVKAAAQFVIKDQIAELDATALMALNKLIEACDIAKERIAEYQRTAPPDAFRADGSRINSQRRPANLGVILLDIEDVLFEIAGKATGMGKIDCHNFVADVLYNAK